MKYLVLRDDDTSAVTQVDHLETLYRPFLERGLPINLAVIPIVNLKATLPGGEREHFLKLAPETEEIFAPIGNNTQLVRYLLDNPGYTLAQHGCHHDFHEFLSIDRHMIIHRLRKGLQALMQAGLSRPLTFVAPQDKLSSVAFKEVAKQFSIISTGWFERNRLPISWWPRYLMAKWRHQEHWSFKGCLLLSRPKSCLSRLYRPETILDQLKNTIEEHSLTVINTHWWEFFPKGNPDTPFIKALHSLAKYLADEKSVKVISFKHLFDLRKTIKL